jgi:hypothetical protein
MTIVLMLSILCCTVLHVFPRFPHTHVGDSIFDRLAEFTDKILDILELLTLSTRKVATPTSSGVYAVWPNLMTVVASTALLCELEAEVVRPSVRRDHAVRAGVGEDLSVRRSEWDGIAHLFTSIPRIPIQTPANIAMS